MSRRRAFTWWSFGGALALATAVLAWLSVEVLHLEHREAEAAASLEHETAVGGVLWRMDAWLAPILAAEAQRPPAEYRAFNPVADAYTNLLSPLTPGDVVTPSPLLGFRSELFPLHFQVDATGKVSSPQVPVGNELDVLQGQGKSIDFSPQRALLDALGAALTPAGLDACSLAAARQYSPSSGVTLYAFSADGAWQSQEATSNYQQRAQGTKSARQKLAWNTQGDEPVDASAGPLLPFWLDSPLGERLMFVRRAPLPGGIGYQGIVADWPRLRDALLAEVAGESVVAGASLVRAPAPGTAPRARLLTTVPAMLETRRPVVTLPLVTPMRGLLLMAWLAFAGVAVLVGFTLRSALSFGDRRARFASAVTHELRTPLTTFRMYSEMLAQGMVTDPERRRQYLETLQTESDRLARLVENVLAYARIEDGRFRAQRTDIDLAGLLDAAAPPLRRRAQEAGVPLELACDAPDLPLRVDTDAVGQILFNLVDNACKYGAGPIEVRGTHSAGAAELSVRDHGNGIPAALHERVFAAFDRGAREPGDNEKPGVGLGLALARSLARDLGGDLRVEDAAPGARFVLRLPGAEAS